MIRENEIIAIGKFGHPHGVNGEISCFLDEPVDFLALRCIVVNIDGINVPFFINSSRAKGPHSTLLTIDGISDERAASEFAGKTIFALKDDYISENDYDDGDQDSGLYADDLIGFSIVDTSGRLNGTITDVDDTTENVLFIVYAENSTKPILIPVANEYIDEVDQENRILTVDLPDGFLDL